MSKDILTSGEALKEIMRHANRQVGRPEDYIGPGEWQPIETAPTDGEPLLLFARAQSATSSGIVVGWCIDGRWIECCFAPNWPVGLAPSHWQWLPDFPNN